MSKFSQEMSALHGVTLTDDEIQEQVEWTDIVKNKVSSTTGCQVTDESIAIIIVEFCKRVEELKKREQKNHVYY